MSENGSKPDHEGLATAIARALKPQFDGIGERLDRMNVRMDQLVENTGGHYRRLEDRITRLETKVFAGDDDEE